MFGYVRPFRPELKCKELDLYKASYCGLCCTLRERYGLLAPMFLSYDLTFLAILLEEPASCYHPCKGRCHGNLFCKKMRVPPSEALNRCADITVILAWFQLQDTIADDGWIKKNLARFLCLFLKPSYKKAHKHLPDFSAKTQQSLATLQQLEQSSCASMDRVADCFASILRDTVPEDVPEAQKRCFQQILYHVGRWIYLIDARDDLEEDKTSHSYNPLLLRYGEEIPQDDLSMTLNHSVFMAKSALDFLDFGVRQGLIENMFQFGFPVVQDAVLEDRWKRDKKQKIWRKYQ